MKSLNQNKSKASHYGVVLEERASSLTEGPGGPFLEGHGPGRPRE